jgi:hypothetical protein
MNAYVFNQPRRHQLFSNALHVLETKINKNWMTHYMTNLIKDDKVVALEFSMLASNIKKQASDVLKHFFNS